MALEQHFGDGGRSPEIPVYLEPTRGVEIEKVVGHMVPEELPQVLPGQVPLKQPRP